MTVGNFPQNWNMEFIDVTKSENMFVNIDALFFIFIGGLSSNHESQVNNTTITRHDIDIYRPSFGKVGCVLL